MTLPSLARLLADSLRSWRSTNALDKSPSRPSTGADRQQAVIHALLRSKDQIPRESPDPALRRSIARRLENITPNPAPVSGSRSGTIDALRIGAAPALVAVALALGVHVVSSQFANRGAPLAPALTNSGQPNTDRTAVANSAHDPLNPDAGRQLAPGDLFVPVDFGATPPALGQPQHAGESSSLMSLPLMREASALQQAGPLLQDAIRHRLPPMPERPK